MTQILHIPKIMFGVRLTLICRLGFFFSLNLLYKPFARVLNAFSLNTSVHKTVHLTSLNDFPSLSFIFSFSDSEPYVLDSLFDNLWKTSVFAMLVPVGVEGSVSQRIARASLRSNFVVLTN